MKKETSCYNEDGTLQVHDKKCDCAWCWAGVTNPPYVEQLSKWEKIKTKIKTFFS